MCVSGIGRRPRLLSVVTGLAFLVTGCSTHSSGGISGQMFVEVWHSSGGPAPVLSSVAVDTKGWMQYASPSGRVHRARLAASEYQRIQVAVNSSQFADSVQEAARQGESYSDYEEVEILVRGWEASVPTELAPAELEAFLGLVGDLIEKHFGAAPPWKI